jgi:excisionase family DNA binding protein
MSEQEALLLTVEEARGLCNLGRTTFYALLRQGVIPSLKLGKSIRIPRKALVEWIDSQTKTAG